MSYILQRKFCNFLSVEILCFVAYLHFILLNASYFAGCLPVPAEILIVSTRFK